MILDNLFWGMQFRTCKNFWEQQTASLVLSQKFLQIQKPHRHYFDCDYTKANRLRIKRESVIFRHCETCEGKSWQSKNKGNKKMKQLKLSTLPKTWLIDIDGTILRHNGHKDDKGDTLLEGVSEFFANLPKDDKVILLTARESSEMPRLKAFLAKHKIRFDTLISDLPFGERILINDIKPSGLKTAFAINKKRDEKFCVEVERNEDL